MYEGASRRVNGALNGMSLIKCTFQPSKLHSLDTYSKKAYFATCTYLFLKNELDIHVGSFPHVFQDFNCFDNLEVRDVLSTLHFTHCGSEDLSWSCKALNL